MSKNNNILWLTAAGVLLALVNVAVFLAVRSGHIAALNHPELWIAFAVLNVCSLLWSVRLLGLQPLIVATSYAGGGALAFYGVRLLPGACVAEIATAGATFSAFGAIITGGAGFGGRIRGQAPFLFLILSLLVLDGVLSGRILHAGSSVLLSGMVYPFLFCGVMVGLASILLTKLHKNQSTGQQDMEISGALSVEDAGVVEAVEADRLTFIMPVSDDAPETRDMPESRPADEPVAEDIPKTVLHSVADPEPEPDEEDDSAGNFFPLEIDKSAEADRMTVENPGLMSIAAMMAERDVVSYQEEALSPVEDEVVPESVIERAEEDVGDLIGEYPDPSIVTALDEEVEVDEVEEHSQPSLDHTALAESEQAGIEKKEVDSEDWLSSHMDLLRKLK